MPELPDLQVFSRNLTRKLNGKKIRSVSVPVAKKLNVSVQALKKTLEGNTIQDIFRDGKELHIRFKSGDILGLHMMLRGQLQYFGEKNDHKFTILEILFTDGQGLAMTDYQRQATPTLNPAASDAEDALSRNVDYSFLKDVLGRSKAVVKNVLLDQHTIRGIGNAYADEILWDAGISPFSVSNKIPDSYIRKLAKSIKSVLKNAEKSILKSHPGIIGGEVRDFLSVHNFQRKQTPTGGIIQIKKSGARKTYYTDEQKLFK